MSSNAVPGLPGLRTVLSACALLLLAMVTAPVTAQDDSSATAPAEETAPPLPPPPPERINILVTVPRGEVNQAQVQDCENRADASTISGEIVVCGAVGSDGSNGLSASRDEAQKRYAEETAFKDAPRTPDAFGIPSHGNSIGFGSVPPPALLIDVEALPDAPAGSDADRIARGLPPLGEEGELTEEEEKARREAAGIKTTVPPRSKTKG